MSPWLMEDLEALDDDLRAKLTQKNSLVAEQWGRYSRLERCSIDSHRDIAPFWAQRETALSEAVLPYVFFPVSSAVIERSFMQPISLKVGVPIASCMLGSSGNWLLSAWPVSSM